MERRQGGTISGNKGHGVLANQHGKVTVAAVDRPQTVSSGNGVEDWATRYRGEIEGLAEGIQAKVVGWQWH